MKKHILFALVPTLLLTGCQGTEKIHSKMLSHMEEKYSEDFEIVDYNYNKTYGCYEIGVQTDAIKDGLAAEVDYYRNGEIYDGYYANLYLAEVTEAFENVLDLSGEYYTYSEYLIDMMGPQNKTNSYEEYKSCMKVDTAVVMISLFLGSGFENPEEIKQKVSGAIQSLENPNCDVDVYFVSERDLYDVKNYVTTHYRRYDSDDLLSRYAYDFRIRKRNDSVSAPKQ